jgi:hypothetical protein
MCIIQVASGSEAHRGSKNRGACRACPERQPMGPDGLKNDILSIDSTTFGKTFAITRT